MDNPNDFIQVNIKELPIIDNIQYNDQLIVETLSGTNSIVFESIALAPENTTFYNVITATTTNLVQVSSNYTAIENNNLPLTTVSELTALSSSSSSTLEYLSSSTYTAVQLLSSEYKNTYVNDNYIINSPYGVKAMVLFSANGIVLRQTTNIDSVNRLELGKFTINIKNFATNNYVVFATTETASDGNEAGCVIYSKGANAFNLNVVDSTSSTTKTVSSGNISVVIYSN